MKIRDDILEVMKLGAPALEGAKLEPEEAPAQRVLTVDANVKMNSGAPVGGQLNTSVAYQGTAGEFATNIRQACAGCRAFNANRWQAYKARMERSLDLAERQHLNSIRAALLETQNARLVELHPGDEGDLDTENALNALGICDAFTDYFHEYIYVHPLGGCPTTDEQGRVLPILYQPRDREAKRNAAKRYDNVLNMARGKIP